MRSRSFSALIVPVACKKAETPEKPAISTFASPDDASNALLAAAKSGDQNALIAIFGPDSKELISSGDGVQDKNISAAFVTGYEVMHRWRPLVDGSQMLLVGADNFPFPIPLKKNADGKWFFDTAAGKDEVLNRRIGRNELAIIDVCEAAAEAQAEYYSKPHDGQKAKLYAAKFLSDPGKQNGLYWKTEEGQPPSPLGPLFAFATAEGYTANPQGHTPFHGYYFKPLKGQTDKAPGGAKEYMVNGKDVRWIRPCRLSRRVRKLRRHDLHHQSGWSAAAEGPRQVHHGNSNRNDLVRSRSQLGHRTALDEIAREKRSLEPQASLSSISPA